MKPNFNICYRCPHFRFQKESYGILPETQYWLRCKHDNSKGFSHFLFVLMPKDKWTMEYDLPEDCAFTLEQILADGR